MVMTCTCVSVTSGKASTGSWRKASQPAAAKAPVNRSTPTRWARAASIRRSSMGSSGLWLAVVDLGAHEQRALGDEALAGGEAGDDTQLAAAGLAAGLD